jgi:CubicO group peptidase (beta-lactamase class C family)
MKRRIVWVSGVLATFVFHAIAIAGDWEITRAEDVGMSTEKLANLKSQLEKVLAEEKTGGIQVLVSRHGKVIMYENLGFANVEEEIAVTKDTLFRVFSMTKPIVGAAMMMLYEEGHYSLADPLSKHIPEFAELEVFAGTEDDGTMILEDLDREPTMQDLMMHTAGFTYGIFGDSPVDRMYVESEVSSYEQTLQDFIDKLAEMPLLFQPGERWNYSVAVDVQGYLIEQWTGMELGEFLQKRLFDPLGMDQTMPWVPPDKAGLLANIYSHDENGNLITYEGTLATNHYRAPGGFGGGAQLISTSDDYWRFCQMLLNGGEFEGKRYLSPRTVDLMSRDRLDESITLPWGKLGFGLNVAVVSDPTVIGYTANKGEYFWGGLATTLFWIDPEDDLVVIMLTQYLPWNEPYYRDLMHRLVYASIVE